MAKGECPLRACAQFDDPSSTYVYISARLFIINDTLEAVLELHE